MDNPYFQYWDKIIHTMYNGIIIIDNQGLVLMCNPMGCKLTGFPKEELLGKHINDVLEDTDFYSILDDGKPRTYQQQTNNHTVITNGSPIYKEDQIIGAVVIFQDITKLEFSLSQLSEKEKEIKVFKEIFELVYDGIIVVDADSKVTMINQSYCDFLGINLEESLGKPVVDVIENTRLHIVLETGQAEIGSIMKVKNREIVVMRLPIRKDGKIVGAIGKVMFTDIHDLTTLAKRLNVVEGKLDYYRNELKRVQGSRYSFEHIIGENEKMREAKELALKVASSRSTVLIMGESGTGKELFAHALHGASLRSEGAFIRLNCSAIPGELMEAELFGYEEGAFTGAKKGGKAGKIELADKGTLFLDEIGDMPLTMQVKILRVLQEKEVERLGGINTKQVDIRIIAATHRSLEEMVEKGEFRLDLYYRLNVFRINIPPLRERGEDIITTAHFILGRLNDELGRNIKEFSPEVKSFFKNYHWEGNVRELQNVIERSIHMVDSSEISMEHLPPYLTNGLASYIELSPNVLEKELEKTEIKVIKHALRECNGNRIKASQLLGIHRASLYRKIEKYKL